MSGTTETAGSALRAELAQFTGSETWYRAGFPPHVIFTEGMHYLADAAGAHWLIEAIASHLVTKPKLKAHGLLFWKLEKIPGGTWRLSARRDTGEPMVARQEIEYSDFPLDSIDVWTAWDGMRWTIYLPSEH